MKVEVWVCIGWPASQKKQGGSWRLKYKSRRPPWAEWGKGVPGSKDIRAELWRQRERAGMQAGGKGSVGGVRPPLGHQGTCRPQTELAHQKEQPLHSRKTWKRLNVLPSYPCPCSPVSFTGRSTKKSPHAEFHLGACFVRGPELILKIMTNIHLIIMQFSTAISWRVEGINKMVTRKTH